MVFTSKHIKIFAVQPNCLRLFGIWPDRDGTFNVNQTRMAFFNIGCIMCIMSFEARFTLNSSDYQALIANAFALIFRALSTMKIAIVQWKRKDLQSLTKNLVDMIEMDDDPISRKINFRMSKSEFGCAVGILGVYLTAMFTMVTTPVLKWVLSGQNEWELPFFIQTPFKYERPLVYQLTYLIVSYTAFLITLAIPAMDGLFSGFCLYISGQFDIVAKKIENLIDWEDSDVFSDHQNLEVKERLAKVIERHNQCIEITKQMVSFFKEIIFVEFIFTALLLALASVALLIASSLVEVIKYLICVQTYALQLFLFCKCGSFITESSGRVATAAYAFPWYKGDKEVRTMIQQIIIRAQKACKISVPFVEVSLETFTNIVNSTASLVTLLKSFY